MRQSQMTSAENVLDAAPVYELKPSPYSSHSQLLNILPAAGNGMRVLDVGCGNGYIGDLLARRGYRVTGVERRGGYNAAFPADVELIEADLEAGLPPIHQRFSYILCADTEHLRDPGALLTCSSRCLSPMANW